MINFSKVFLKYINAEMIERGKLKNQFEIPTFLTIDWQSYNTEINRCF